MGDTGAVRVHVVDDERDLRAIEPAWRALLERAVHPQPTQTPAWLSSWWRVFGGSGGRELRLVVVEAGGEMIGLVPLLRRWQMQDGVFPMATLELLGSGEAASDEICSEYIGAIAARGHEGEVARALAGAVTSGALGGWDELRLVRMSSDDPTVPLLADALRGRGAGVELTVTDACPFVRLPSTWEGYLAQLDGSRRYFARRTLSDVETWAGPGGLALKKARTPAELARGWNILCALHEERWDGAGAFQSEHFRRFHELVTARLLRGDGGSLELLWLEVRGAPVAVLYNIVHRGDVHFYQSGRSRDVPRQVRPGIALHLYAIRRAIEQGCQTYDFLAPAHPYKQKLAPACQRHLLTLSAAAPSLRARAFRGARRTARQIWDLARSARRGEERSQGVLAGLSSLLPSTSCI
jgi:CelD/BcsL family acetyltransferase involved in cellulose biosynthesis